MIKFLPVHEKGMHPRGARHRFQHVSADANSLPLANRHLHAVTVLFSGLYFKRRLGGITGDCLGAVNQITEATLYLLGVLH